MRGKKIIAFCRRLLADLQTREKRLGYFSVPLVYSWIFPPSEAVERNFDAHGSGGENGSDVDFFFKRVFKVKKEMAEFFNTANCNRSFKHTF